MGAWIDAIKFDLIVLNFSLLIAWLCRLSLDLDNEGSTQHQ